MCGICGILDFEGTHFSRDTLKAMTDSLVHRGPDGEGFYMSTAHSPGGRIVRLGLGHRRLKIIDLSEAASQPMSNEDRSLWIVFNGEIYNYLELQAALKARGHLFRSRTDTEVILHLYEEKGVECLTDLEGMFAFALWDQRKHTLFLARDRAGQKPLFYFHQSLLFAFASEVKALLQHPRISAEVNPEAISHYFSFGYPPFPKTLLHGIHQLSPGSYMIINIAGEARIRQYWDLTFPRVGQNEIQKTTNQRATKRVREMVTDAVRKRMESDVPLGVFLSGGIDSTIIVGVMSRILNDSVRTFSIGFAGNSDFDESPYARIAATSFKTKHTEFIVEPNAINLIETLVWHHDGPFGDSSAIPTYIISQLARESVTVALNGDGGDELFAGYPRFYAGLLSEKIPRSIGKIFDTFLSLLPESKNYLNVLRRAQNLFRSASLPLPDRFIRWNNFSPDDLHSLVSGDLIGPHQPGSKVSWFREIVDAIAGYSPLLGVKIPPCTLSSAQKPLMSKRKSTPKIR